MREIKFRGKAIDENKWYYGDFCTIPEPNILFWNDKNELDVSIIDVESVGQYTGLKDKNGEEIYEGDIVKVTYKKKHIYDEKAIIIFYSNAWCIDMSTFYPFCREDWIIKIPCDLKEIEIVGNVNC